MAGVSFLLSFMRAEERDVFDLSNIKCNLKECQPLRIISWRSNLKKIMWKGSCWLLHFSVHILSFFPTPSSSSSSNFPSCFLLNPPNLLLQSSYHLIMFFTALWHSTFSISFLNSSLQACCLTALSPQHTLCDSFAQERMKLPVLLLR